MALNKVKMADLLSSEIGINQREAKEFMECFFDEIGKVLATGDKVQLPGFGTFLPRDKNRRLGRNPRTREPIPISARRVVTFRPAPKLKARLARHARSRLS